MLKKSFMTGLCLGVVMGTVYYMFDREKVAEVSMKPVSLSKADTRLVSKFPAHKEASNYKYSDWLKVNKKFDPKNERFLYYSQMSTDQIKEEIRRLNASFSPDTPHYMDVGDYYHYEYLSLYYLAYRWASRSPREALNFKDKENIEERLQ